jgi:hypothetical protein
LLKRGLGLNAGGPYLTPAGKYLWRGGGQWGGGRDGGEGGGRVSAQKAPLFKDWNRGAFSQCAVGGGGHTAT